MNGTDPQSICLPQKDFGQNCFKKLPISDTMTLLSVRGGQVRSQLLHKTTFGEPLGVPVIKPTQILNQPDRTGLYSTKESHKKKKELNANTY